MKKVAFMSLVLVLLAMPLLVGFRAEAAQVELEVLNPQGVIDPPKTIKLSPRLDTLNGKMVMLYTNGKSTTGEFFDEVERLLKKSYPTVTIVRQGGAFFPGKKRAKEFAQQVDALIYGNGD